MATWIGMKRSMGIYLCAPMALLLLAGCGSAPVSKSASAPATATTAACGDKGPALPGTGICQGSGTTYLKMAAGKRPAPPSGCEWVVNEVAMPADEYLLYLAAKCKGKVAQLEFSGGAHLAQLNYVASPMFGDSVKGHKLVTIASVDEGDPKAVILRVARETNKNRTEAARCQVRPAGIDPWPADSLVVDLGAAEVAKLPKDGPRTACGPFGLDEDSQTFWRAFQGFAWFFELGQEEPEIDPGSLTLVHKDAQGKWVRSE